MGRRTVIGDAEALALRRQWEREILPKVDQPDGKGAEVRALLKGVFQRVSEGRLGDVTVAAATAKKRDLAEAERQWWENWYHQLGFADIQIPKPAVSNREMSRFVKNTLGLIYVPAASREFYEQFMAAVGQGSHGTVASAERKGIVWDRDLPHGGYWLKAETNQDCPRLGTAWNTLNQNIRLLALAEYAILWHSRKARTGQILDLRTWCWLRTRYNFGHDRIGALRTVRGYSEQVDVNMDEPKNLTVPNVNAGGRAAEVVQNAA